MKDSKISFLNQETGDSGILFMEPSLAKTHAGKSMDKAVFF